MLTNTTNVDRYLITGTPLATYAIHFPYWDKEEINVYLTNSDGSLSTLTEGTNYTLSTPNGNNGTLTRVGDWTAGATNLTIIREMSLTQEVDLRNGDKIDAETLETALDNLTAQVQQLAETQSRAVVSSVDEAGSNLAIPNKASRIGSGSGTMMGFGSDGESIVLRDLAQFDADVASAASDASAAATSASNANYEALRSEGYAVGEQNNMPVGNTSPYYHNNSKYYSLIAKAGADVIEDNITAINTISANVSDINDVADDISNIDAVASDLTNIDSVAGDLTNIDAVNSNKTNIDTVAGIESDVTTVAGISSDVTTVAGATTDIAAILPDISDVSAVAADLTKVTAVADDLTNIDSVNSIKSAISTVSTNIFYVGAVGANIANVNAVATNATNINAVNSNKTNIDTVAGNTSDISTVAGISSDVSTVAGIASDVSAVEAIDSDVTTVAGIASDVSAVAAIDDDVSAVASNETNINTVATDIADVSAVAADLTKVTAVADDLTNIDAVADDLTNIDNAVNYALEAEGFAVGEQNGTPVSSGSPYYQNNAKYYSQEVPALKDAIDSNSQRIENLEVAVSGSLVQTNTDATMANTKVITNANSILPWAILKRVGARAIAWNQFISNGNFADGTGWQTGNASISVADNVATVTVSAQYGGIIQYSTKLITGHKYLMFADVKPATNTQTIAMYCYKGSGYNAVNYHGGTGWYTLSNIFTLNGTSATATIMVQETTSEFVAFNVRNVMIFDLTAMSLDSLTANEFRSMFPASYYPYDTEHIIDLNPSGMKVVGKNKWDGVWINGYYAPADGLFVPSSSHICSKNYIPVEASTEYYTSQSGGYVCFYDANKNFISSYDRAQGTSFTTPPNASYIMFNCGSSYGGTYNNDVIFCLNSVTDKTYEGYSTVTVDTSVLAGSHYVNSSCYDYVENVIEDGVVKGKKHVVVGSYTFDGTETWNNYGANGKMTTISGIVARSVSSNVMPTNIITDINLPLNTRDAIGGGSDGIQITGTSPTSTIIISDSSLATAGKKICFELATETVTYVDPIPNFPVEDGTTVQAITPQTDLVNAIDVPSTIAYMTKIGG